MREKASAVEHELRHRRNVVQRARKPLAAQELTRLGENALRLIAQAEERFLAAGAAATLGKVEHLVRSHEMRTGLAGVFAEGAVAAVVAAERGERNENFFRETDDRSLPASAQV